MIELATDRGLLGRMADELAPPVPAPALDHHDRVDREAARFAWATRIIDEYRSVAVFSELLRLLADLEAPFAVACAMHRLIGDELRHAKLTATVADWLGGHADLAIDLADLGLPPRGDDSAATRAIEIVARELVVGEEESIFALAAYRDATTEPAIRAILDAILFDEVRHAAVGRALLAELSRGRLGELTADARRSLPAIMAEDRAALRDDYRRSARGGAGRRLGGSIALADLDAIWRERG